MNTDQEEVVARVVLEDLKRRQSLRKQARRNWRRKPFMVLMLIVVLTIQWGPRDRWQTGILILTGGLIIVGYEIGRVNRRLDALLQLHEELEEKIEKSAAEKKAYIQDS